MIGSLSFIEDMKLTITLAVVMAGTGASSNVASMWLDPLNSAFDAYSISTPNPIAAALANYGVESGGLVNVVENLNYSAQGLANTWPRRYAVDPSSNPKVPNALANKIARNPQAIANATYGGRVDLGNGSPDSGDGWLFRGRGLLQITGRANYQTAANALCLDLINNPDLLAQPAGAALSAAEFFVRKGCVALAESDCISAIVQIINGQLPCTANQGALRISRYNAVKQLLAA